VIEFQKTHFDHEVRHAYGEVLSGLEMLRTVASDGSVKVISNTPHVPIKAMPQKWLKRGVLVMGNIPLDLQRRFEQRWAARFYRPNPPTAPEKQELERQDQQLATPGKGKRKTHQVKPVGGLAGPGSDPGTLCTILFPARNEHGRR
jgi:hypothetical protein